jgi:glycosyltransferase involved in cell wall biosynthesis
MRVLILGDLSNVHIQKQCQWLVDHEVDILPSGSTDPMVIASKIKVFNPNFIHAMGDDYCKAIGDTEVEIGTHVILRPGAYKCVNTNRFKPSGYSPFRRTFAKSEIGKVVLVPNRMSPIYHCETVVSAFDQVLKKIPDVSLVFHNPGEDVSYQDKITAMINDLGISDSVFSSSYVQYVRMPEIYNAADVVVALPAPEELSCVVMEAAACEVPVITTRGVINERLVFPTNLVNPENPDVLAETILRNITANGEWKKRVGNRKLVRELYEQDNIMDILLSKYQQEMI